MLAIRLPHEIEMRLSSLASKTGRTKTYYSRKAILELIEDDKPDISDINKSDETNRFNPSTLTVEPGFKFDAPIFDPYIFSVPSFIFPLPEFVKNLLLIIVLLYNNIIYFI